MKEQIPLRTPAVFGGRTLLLATRLPTWTLRTPAVFGGRTLFSCPTRFSACPCPVFSTSGDRFYFPAPAFLFPA